MQHTRKLLPSASSRTPLLVKSMLPPAPRPPSPTPIPRRHTSNPACNLVMESLQNRHHHVCYHLYFTPIYKHCLHYWLVYHRLFLGWSPCLRSQFWNGVGYSSRIRILSPQWSLLKWFHRPLLLRDLPWHPGNGQCHNCILVGKLTSYISRRCSVWLTVSWSQ